MKTLVLRLPGPPLLVMTLVAVVCSIAVADAADSTKIGTSTDGDAGRHSETDQGTGALKTDYLFIDWDIINWDWKKDTDQIAKVGLSESQIAQAAQEEDESAAPKSAQCLEFERDLHADLGDVLRAGCEPTLAQMSALMDNPVGNVAMLFTQFDFTKLKNPANDKTANKYNYMGIAQFPKSLSVDWNLINRVVWNVPSMPLDSDKIDDFGTGPGGEILPPSGSPPALIDLFDGRTTGFGDMYYVGLFSPKEPIRLEGGANVVWGAGFDLGFPTATDDLLGTGKWTGGPSALGVYLGPKWKVGALVQQYWDFAGDDDRDDVNLTNLQYLWYYSLDSTTSIGAAPNVIANWEQSSGNKWTVPVGIGINKTVQFGKVPVRLGVEMHYSVIQPDDVAGAEWNLRFYIIPALPSALFKWMQ